MKCPLPRCLLFDLDGTILDSLPGISFSVDRACQAAGLHRTDADLRTLLGPPIRNIFSRLAATGDSALLDRLEAAFRSSYDSEGWQLTRCFEGARETLQAIQAGGYRLFVITNKPQHISLLILEREGLLNFFERVYTRDSRTPPYAGKVEMLEDFLRDSSVSPSECLTIGDTMEDIRASAAMRIPMALMEHGYGEVGNDVPVAMRLQSFSDFLTYLNMGCAR